MNHPHTPATASADARERLAQTRRELLRHMQMERGDADPDPVQRHETQPPQDERQRQQAAPEDQGLHDDPAGSTWQHLRHSLGAWWHSHPAHLALEVAQPVFEKYARAHPMKVLGVCAAGGAVLVLARPWRLISITGLLVAALKSSQMSALAGAMLRTAPPSYPRHDERKHP